MGSLATKSRRGGWGLGFYEIVYFGYRRFVALAVEGVAEVLQKLEHASIAEELGDLFAGESLCVAVSLDDVDGVIYLVVAVHRHSLQSTGRWPVLRSSSKNATRLRVGARQSPVALSLSAA